jgi:hypothetical protein
MRWCPRCEQSKPIGEFLLPKGPIRGHCRTCRLALTKAWKAAHHDELLDRRRAGYPPARYPNVSASARNRRRPQPIQ